MFQSTLPHGERLVDWPMSRLSSSFQSTLPHGERPHLVTALTALVYSFNPRSRMGSDTLRPPNRLDSDGVSIHAPAWGATRDMELNYLTEKSFNPRSRMGSDVSSNSALLTHPCFNPRSAWGAYRYPPTPTLTS